MHRRALVRWLPWIMTPLLLALLVGVWKVVSDSSGISAFLLPPPDAVAEAALELVLERDTWMHARTTFTEAALGFAFAVCLGAPVGVLLGNVVWLDRSLRPMIVGLQVVPKVALVPLFVIWFGFGMTSKIMTAAIFAFFPIMLNVLLGVRSIDAGHRDLMRSLNASRWAVFRSLVFHSTLPYLFAGMEVGIVFAVIGAIVGEYLGGNSGLGYMLVVALNALDAPRLFAVIVLLALLGYAVFLAIGSAKRLMIPWHDSLLIGGLHER